MQTSEAVSVATQGQREQEAKALHTVFANACCLYLINRNFYWNASGPKQHTLRRVFEAHYTDLEETINHLAGRIRALGIPVKCSCSDILEFSTIHEPRNINSADTIEEAIRANTALVESACSAQAIAESKNDTTTLDLLFELTTTHQRFLQTLESLRS